MIEAIFKTLAAGLTLWNSKEKSKYIDKLYKTKKAWYEEYNKDNPDDAILDNLEHELCILADAFASKVRIEDA